MRAERLTRALGGKWHGGYGMACCPAHDDSKPSLSIKDGRNGLLLHCFAGCGYADVRAALVHILRGSTVLTRPEHSVTSGKAKSLSDLAAVIWRQGRTASGTLVERYLRGRAIESAVPLSIRFHPRLRHPSGAHYPAMLARVDHIARSGFGLNRTYLDARAVSKAKVEPNKAMLGPCAGGAVQLRLGASALIVCEGIETGLSIRDAAAPGVAVWAALTTTGLRKLQLPKAGSFDHRLVVATDGDAPGRKAGETLGERAAQFGWNVEISSPPDGFDFNDIARGLHHA
ncbi:MAG: toprim domain-containing protein [Pseudomonadota bacterium]